MHGKSMVNGCAKVEFDKRSAGKYCEKLHGTHTVRRADSDAEV